MSKREYHYVLTLQFRRKDGNGSTVNTVSGTVEADRGVTRQTLYRDVYESACEKLDAEDAVTLFCMLEPNELGDRR